MNTQYDTLTLLQPGSTHPSKVLETVPNPYSDRDYTIDISTPEFTCLCPVTGQPDFAEIRVLYVPDERIVELKSLKLYFWSYRNEGVFHEAVVNMILDDVIAACAPRRLEVIGTFNVRGGLKTVVTAGYGGTPHS